MSDALVAFFRSTLPEDLAVALNNQLDLLEAAKFDDIFKDNLVQNLLGHQNDEQTKAIQLKDFPKWNDFVFRRLEVLLPKREDGENSNIEDSPAYKQHIFLITALAAIGAFLQSNVTGPPLPFSSATALFPADVETDKKSVKSLRASLVDSLATDGVAAYKLTPNVELFSLADTILTHPALKKNIPAATWTKLRIDFLHQRLLSEVSPSLEQSIYDGMEEVRRILAEQSQSSRKDPETAFLLEKATIHTHHGQDKFAREALDLATKERGFEFALTGMMGKRTKFQQKDVSQLVVLARSAEDEVNGNEVEQQATAKEPGSDATSTFVPKALNLNDDTVLESISFTKPETTAADVKDETALSPRLTSLNPEKQPILNSLDSIILLLLAASITNTNPENGMTREETAPYATRVVEGGSSNWQVYTHALLLRSRIEGYRSRTVERGLLQLQALVDQVIADTASAEDSQNHEGKQATTFLPKATVEESAPASQRLAYVFQLCSPSRWELEAELAARWTSLGGLRSALDIYERLEMWPEAALCWAGIEREDKARRIVRRQLFHSTAGNDETVDPDTDTWEGKERDPPPAEAPRLYCILADFDKDPSLFEKAWEVSNQRYARAQRELGRHHYGKQDYAEASLAFDKSLKVKQLDHATWFALGCSLLELELYKRAVEAFSRAVQLDDTDGEAWSNLAAALLNLSPDDEDNPTLIDASTIVEEENEDENGILSDQPPPRNPQQNITDALQALKHAARLKSGNHRIWSNLLTVSASLSPPSWSDILVAQKRIIDLRGPTDGEACIDIPILSAVVRHVVSTCHTPTDLSKPGLPKMLLQLMERDITPLITGSATLWRLLSTLALARDKPTSALTAQEKAWRCVVSQPGWETGKESEWDGVVEATIDLASAYETFGPKEKTEGLGAGGGEVVMKEWRFKSRSAIRGIMGRGKDSWEGTIGWDRLVEALEGLKASS
ncbi:TPR-like protein [Venturia nashicola]|nr:TPR-like protein [Venturia nashicola]